MNLDSIRQILESEYSQSDWRNFLKEIFPTAEIFATPKKIDAANDGLPSGLQLGRVMLADGKRIAFIEQPEPASTVSGFDLMPRHFPATREIMFVAWPFESSRI